MNKLILDMAKIVQGDMNISAPTRAEIVQEIRKPDITLEDLAPLVKVIPWDDQAKEFRKPWAMIVHANWLYDELIVSHTYDGKHNEDILANPVIVAGIQNPKGDLLAIGTTFSTNDQGYRIRGEWSTHQNSLMAKQPEADTFSHYQLSFLVLKYLELRAVEKRAKFLWLNTAQHSMPRYLEFGFKRMTSYTLNDENVHQATCRKDLV